MPLALLWVGVCLALGTEETSREEELWSFRTVSYIKDFSRPEAAALSLIQNDDGFLWHGYKGGLGRIDPAGNLKLVSVGNRLSKSSWVLDLALSPSDAGLWAVTKDRLLHLDDQLEIQAYPLPEDLGRSFTSLTLSQNGRLFLGSDDGLLEYLVEEKRFLALGVEVALQDVLADSQNPEVLWLASPSSGLLRYDTENGEITTLAKDEEVYILHQTGDGVLWAGGENEIFRIVPGNKQPDRFAVRGREGGLSGRVLALAEDPYDGDIWVSTEELPGLLRLNSDSGGSTHYTREFPVSGRGPVNSLVFDETGLLWAAMPEHGVFHADLEDRVARIFRHDPSNPRSIPSGRILGLKKTSEENRILLGTSQGAAFVEIESGLVEVLREGLEISGENPLLALEILPNDLPLALTRQGLFLWENGVWTREQSFRRRGFSKGCLAVDDHHAVWISAGATLHRWDQNTSKAVGLGRTLPETITCLAAKEGSVFIGTTKHAYYLGKTDKEVQSLSLGEVQVRSIEAVTKHAAYFATKQGLYRADLQSVPWLKMPCAKPLHSVVTSQSGGGLWLGSDTGLHWFDNESLEMRQVISSSKSSDQNVTPEKNLVLEGGRLVFGQRGCLGTLSEKDIQQRKIERAGRVALPMVSYIQEAPDGDDSENWGGHEIVRPIVPGEELVLDHKVRAIRFWARLMDYRHPTGNMISYRIDDGAWITLKGNAKILMARLEPGYHLLEVKGRSLLGTPSVNTSQIKIKVEAPFTETRTFRLLAAGVFLGTILLLLLNWLRLLSRNARLLSGSEKRYRRLFDNSSDAILLLDAEHRVVHGNPAAANFFATPDAETLEGIEFSELVAGSKDGEALVQDLADSEVVEKRLVSLAPVNERERSALCTVNQIDPSEDRVLRMRVQFTDMTEKLQLEAQVTQGEKMNAVGTLAGGIAHDFNNLLSPIMVHGEMALDDLEENTAESRESIRESLEITLEAARKASDLVSQILNYSRRQDHKTAELVDVEEVVSKSVQLLRGTVHYSVQIRVESSLGDERIRCAPARLQQIIMNLGVNAYQAIGAEVGQIAFHLSPEKIEMLGAAQVRPGEYIKLMVEDTGVGMSKEITKRIFEPFFTTRSPGSGTGLGLATVHQAVQDLGGVITVESERGKGSRFINLLPPQNEVSVEPIKMQKPGVDSGQSRMLMLVDDEPLVLHAGRRLLESLGHKVISFGESPRALEYLLDPEQPAPDLVITDLMMPDLVGTDLARASRKAHPNLPWIILTGFADSLIDQTELSEIGVQAVHMKPLDYQALEATLQALLEDRDGAVA